MDEILASVSFYFLFSDERNRMFSWEIISNSLRIFFFGFPKFFDPKRIERFGSSHRSSIHVSYWLGKTVKSRTVSCSIIIQLCGTSKQTMPLLAFTFVDRFGIDFCSLLLCWFAEDLSLLSTKTNSIRINAISSFNTHCVSGSDQRTDPTSLSTGDSSSVFIVLWRFVHFYWCSKVVETNRLTNWSVEHVPKMLSNLSECEDMENATQSVITWILPFICCLSAISKDQNMLWNSSMKKKMQLIYGENVCNGAIEFRYFSSWKECLTMQLFLMTDFLSIFHRTMHDSIRLK